ncbi:Pentatricopeptide repeat-containing protein, mitochondrial [Sesamum angolense]|uniref:Pentatricopeptide repeat-containing protein, mitochondrial n=1 Tax=Sesamum angolense TaxID=2727404 RepID=A0AAE1VZX2_9LAMI|nr:Pentatricopeptide repeat-containing protein, mitochondrial [Sesamum angolense]
MRTDLPRLKANGVTLETYHKPFCKDVDSVRSDSDGENESFVVDDAEFETDQKEVGVLERFKHARKPALRLFCWAAERPGFAHDSRTYNAMMNILGKTRQFETMVSVLEEMGSKDLLTVETFSICIKAFAAAKERKKAVGCFGNQKKMDMVYRLLNEMKEKGCPPDGRMYNALLKMMANRHLPDDAEMKRNGCCPDENSCTVLIGRLIRRGRSNEACKYLEEIDKGMKAPQLDYNKFTADFCRAGRANILEDLAQKMKFSGNSDVADLLERWMR